MPGAIQAPALPPEFAICPSLLHHPNPRSLLVSRFPLRGRDHHLTAHTSYLLSPTPEAGSLRPSPPLPAPLPLCPRPSSDAAPWGLSAPSHALQAHLPGLHTWVARAGPLRPGREPAGAPPPARPARCAAMFTEGGWRNPSLFEGATLASGRGEHRAEGAYSRLREAARRQGSPSLKGKRNKGRPVSPKKDWGA